MKNMFGKRPGKAHFALIEHINKHGVDALKEPCPKCAQEDSIFTP